MQKVPPASSRKRSFNHTVVRSALSGTPLVRPALVDRTVISRIRRRLFRRGHGFSSLQFGAIAFVFLVCLAVVGNEVSNIQNQRGRELNDAWSQAANLARSLGQHAEDTVRNADISIFGAAQRLEIDGTSPETLDKLRPIMMARVAAFPALANFVITDETGRCLMVSLPQIPEECSLAGRADFEYHRTHRDSGSHLNQPVRSMGAGTWIIPVSRRFNHPDGSFGGIVMTGISIPFFQSYYDKFDIGPRGAILLATDTDDPVLLVRRPFVEANIGRSLRNSSFFREDTSKTRSGTTEAVSPTDGVRRLVSYWRIEPYPLLVAVAFAKDDALASWREDAWFYMLLTLGLVAVIATLGTWLAFNIRTRRQLEDSYRETAAAFRLLAENSTDFIVRLSPTHERLYASPACRALLGYEPEELIGRSAFDIVHPDDRARWQEHYGGAAAAALDDLSATYRLIRKDGRPIWVEASRRRLTSDGGFVVSARDVTERHEAEQQLAETNRRLQDMADHDALTGLANRRHFDAVLDAEFRRAMRDGTTLSLVMIDVDRFKAFNDRYGHPAGDRCLREVATALKDIPGRAGDLVARYGGEELAIILPNTPLAGALTIAEQARCAVRAHSIAHKGNAGNIVTISLGVAAASRSGGLATPAALIEAADRALYAAKAGGRDAVRGVQSGTPALVMP